MRLSLKIAVRFLKANKGQTLLILLGIAVGVSVQVFLGLLIEGLQKSLIEKTIGKAPHITIASKNDDKKVDFPDDKREKILGNVNSVKSVNISVEASAFVRKNTRTEPVLVRGFTLEEADSIYSISDRLVRGRMPLKQREVLIGKDLRDKLDIEEGERLNLLTSKGERFDLVVCGIYDLSSSNINKSWLITDIKTARGIFNIKGSASALEMQVTDVFSADAVAENIKDILADDEIEVGDWKNQNSELLSGLNGQRASSIMIQVFVLFSVVLGIASVLAISVMQKSRQLGILKAMGIKDRAASGIFLLQGLILGSTGTSVGIVFGLGLSKMFSVFAVNPDGSPLVDMYIDIRFIIISAGIAIISAISAAFVPAMKSAGLDPIEVIRNG